MKIETSTRVRHGQDGKLYDLRAGTHEVPAEVGEYLVGRGHAKAVLDEAPAQPAASVAQVAPAQAEESETAPAAAEETVQADAEAEVEAGEAQAEPAEAEAATAPAAAEPAPAGKRGGKRSQG